MGGAEALWRSQMVYGTGSHQMAGSGGQVNAEVGYGLPVGSRPVGTPRVGLTTSEYGRDYRLGYSLGALGTEGLKFKLGVDAQRWESPALGGTSNSVLGRAAPTAVRRSSRACRWRWPRPGDGELMSGADGFELAFKAEALWVGTSVDGVDGPAGRLKAIDAAVARFRTELEGSRDYTLAGRLSLRPSVEVGLRHDGGNAENGAGMDVDGGLIVSDAGTGLAVDMRVRMLVVHQAEAFREHGIAVSLSYNPTPSTPLGFGARVVPS